MNLRRAVQTAVRRELALAVPSEPGPCPQGRSRQRSRSLARLSAVTLLLWALGDRLPAQPPYQQQVLPAFSSLDVGAYSVPSLADLDGDGDLDVVVGERDGRLVTFENLGGGNVVEQLGSADPFGGADVGEHASPALADLDGDGDFDAVVGREAGDLLYFENTGTSRAPAFVERTGTANPFPGIDVGRDSSPSLVDLDGDGDLDAVVGEVYGSLRTFRNAAEVSPTPIFTELTGAANPLLGFGVDVDSRPSFADLDGDGDFDAVVGERYGSLRYLVNRGTAAMAAFEERTGTANPLPVLDGIRIPSPALADFDGDGDFDAVVGSYQGHLTYLQNIGGAQQPGFLQPAPGAPGAPPFAGFDAGTVTSPTLADLDGDGDLDAVVGEYYGSLHTFENTGTPQAPAFLERTGDANPFAGFLVDYNSTPALADVDGDGDLDAIVGQVDGNLRYFENTGSPEAAAFVERSDGANPFTGVRGAPSPSPALVDLDGDGDLDTVIGDVNGRSRYFENTGSATSPAFFERTLSENPFFAQAVISYASPDLVDFDGDGDFDAVVGDGYGRVGYFENTGTPAVPAFAERTGSANPFDGLDVGRYAHPELEDLDGDGDLDALFGESGGRLLFLRSLGGCVPDATTLCLDDAPGDRRFAVRLAFETVQAGGLSGPGFAVDLSGLGVTQGGLFHFGNPANPELLVKVLRGCAVNQHRWVFHTAGTNVGFTVEVRDRRTGEVKTYTNPDLMPALPVQDTRAFPCDGLSQAAIQVAIQSPPAQLAATTTQGTLCTPGAEVLCIQDRFRVEIDYETIQGGGLSGMARAIPLAPVGVGFGGLFSFFDPRNPEVLLKVLDACGINGHYWIFAAAGTNVGFTLRVTDTVTGQSAQYENPDLMPAVPVQDTRALVCE